MYILVFTVRASGYVALVVSFVCRHKYGRLKARSARNLNSGLFVIKSYIKVSYFKDFGLFTFLTIYKHAPEITAIVTGVRPSTNTVENTFRAGQVTYLFPVS